MSRKGSIKFDQINDSFNDQDYTDEDFANLLGIAQNRDEKYPTQTKSKSVLQNFGENISNAFMGPSSFSAPASSSSSGTSPPPSSSTSESFFNSFSSSNKAPPALSEPEPSGTKQSGILDNVSSMISNAMPSFSSSSDAEAKTTSSSFFSSDSSTNMMQAKDFLYSNNILVKITFFLLAVFLFYIFVKILLSSLVYYYSPKSEVKLLDGMMDSSGYMLINQNIGSNPWKTVMRSVNEREGVEFTWSVWLNVQKITPSYDYNLIFTKGNRNVSSLTECRGANVPLNGPGLYIVNDSNSNSATLVVFMDTFESPGIFEDQSKCSISNPTITIPQIPTDTWVHLLVRCVGNTMDVYVNGLIAKTVTFDSLPKQNYGDIYVGSNGGFTGNISNLYYFNHALKNQAIQTLFAKGPTLKSVDQSSSSLPSVFYNYLSFDWYFQ